MCYAISLQGRRISYKWYGTGQFVVLPGVFILPCCLAMVRRMSTREGYHEAADPYVYPQETTGNLGRIALLPDAFDEPAPDGATPVPPAGVPERGRMLFTDELDRMDDISGPELYRAEVTRIPFLTKEEQACYTDAAQLGYTEAAQHLLLNCLNWTRTKAATVYLDYAPIHADIMDLIGQANVEMVEALPRAIQTSNPVAYLMSVGASAMQRYCMYNDPMVKRPRRTSDDYKPITTVSMEAHAWPHTQTIPAPDVCLVSDEERELHREAAYQVVYDALNSLSQTRREILIAYYGLCGQPARREAEIAEERHMHKRAVESRLRRAKVTLAAKLASYGAGEQLLD